MLDIVAPFDVARAAVMHDILYEKINGFEAEHFIREVLIDE